MKKLNTFVYAILAGMFISIGGIVFLSLENKVIGSIMFAVGLFAICTMKFNLYTGKVCYLFDNKPSYLIDLLIIWLGNFVGTFVTGNILKLTRIYPALQEKAQSIVSIKLQDEPISVFILAIFCDILIYLAVEGYKNNPHELGKYMAILFGVSVFILCGFEHCVANMFYISVGDMWTWDHAIEHIVIVTLGNSLGGVLIPLIKKAFKQN